MASGLLKEHIPLPGRLPLALVLGHQIKRLIQCRLVPQRLHHHLPKREAGKGRTV